MVNVIKKG